MVLAAVLRRRRAALPAALAVAGALGGCAGNEGTDSFATNSTTLTVWSSLPLQGPAAVESREILDGQKLALRRAGGRAGPFTVKLSSLDDSSTEAQGWDPERTAENARRALRDRTSIAYLGESDSGATAMSLPILNASGIPQVSPGASYAGFTQAAGGDKGEPDKYYPAGVRSFARVVPPDTAEAAVLVRAMVARGCRRMTLLEARDLTGAGLARALRGAAGDQGVPVADTVPVTEDRDPADVAEDLAERRGDCAAYAGGGLPWVPALLDALHAAAPDLRLFGGSGLAGDALTGALAPATQARTLVAAPVAPPSDELRSFRDAYERAYGRAPRPAAAYGYASMQVVLRAIVAAGPEGGGNRRSVREALLGLAPAPTPVGPLGIGAGGDPTLDTIELRAVRDGRLAAP